MRTSRTDVVIIGAGPAGIAAAIQLQRQRIPGVVISADAPGGLVRNANLVENYPGFPNGIPGKELAARFARHLRAHGVAVVRDRVTSVRWEGPTFVTTASGKKWRSRYVIIATGSQPKAFAASDMTPSPRIVTEIDGLRRLRNKKIVVIGGGDVAYDYALTLGARNDVVILQRSAQPSCVPVLAQRVAAARRVRVMSGTTIDRMFASGTSVALTGKSGNTTMLIECDAAVVAIGRTAQLDLVRHGLANNKRALIARGVLHIIGDAAHDRFRQTAMCAGDGVAAAMKISEHQSTAKR